MVTITTVGYGDVTPVTTLGRVLATFTALVGVGMFALPTAILGNGFVEEMRSRRRLKFVCPTCGQILLEERREEKRDAGGERAPAPPPPHVPC